MLGDRYQKIELAKNWYKVVQERESRNELPTNVSSEDIFRFMTYWITFNFLFSELNFFEGKYQYSFNGIDNFVENVDKAIVNKVEKTYSKEIVECNNLKNIRMNENTWNERIKIILYIDSVINKLVCSDLLDKAYEKNEFITKPIFSSKGDNIDKSKYYYNIIVNKENNEKLRIMCIILSIYQVRNNLFHGGKSPNVDRDLKLVSECADLLEIILKTVLYYE